MKNRYLPFGYKIADGKIVADSEQVEAVRRIFDAYTAGQTFQQIADALSAQGIPLPFGCISLEQKHGEPYPCQCRLLRYGGIPTNHHRRAV